MKTVAALSQLRNATAAALMICLVASCDGGSGPKAGDTLKRTKPTLTEQSAAGIYSGFFQSTAATQNAIRPAMGVVSETSEIHLMMEPVLRNSQYGGFVSVDGNVLTGTLTEYLGSQNRWFGFDGVRSIDLDGIVSERNTLSGDYTGDDEGVFQLDYDTLYERGSSFSQTLGVWTFDMAPFAGTVYNITLDIGPTGELFGTDTEGCVYAGEVGIIDSRFNAYSIAVIVSSCGPVDGQYSGLAFYDETDVGKALYVLFSNELYAFSTRLSQ